MRYFIICDDSGNPIYCDHPEGMMTCLIFNGLDKFLTERDEHFSQKFKSMWCGGVLFVAQKYKNLSFLVVSDQGESEMYLRTLLRQIFEHMVMLFGLQVMLEGRYTSFTRHKKAIQHIIDTTCTLGDRHQALLVRATERLEVNDRTRGECFNALKNTVQNEKLITHALVFVGTKLLVSYTRGGKSQDIDPSDLLLLINDFHATFHPPNREVEEMELPIADYRDHSNITIRGAQTPLGADGQVDPPPAPVEQQPGEEPEKHEPGVESVAGAVRADQEEGVPTDAMAAESATAEETRDKQQPEKEDDDDEEEEERDGGIVAGTAALLRDESVSQQQQQHHHQQQQRQEYQHQPIVDEQRGACSAPNHVVPGTDEEDEEEEGQGRNGEGKGDDHDVVTREDAGIPAHGGGPHPAMRNDAETSGHSVPGEHDLTDGAPPPSPALRGGGGGGGSDDGRRAEEIGQPTRAAPPDGREGTGAGGGGGVPEDIAERESHSGALDDKKKPIQQDWPLPDYEDKSAVGDDREDAEDGEGEEEEEEFQLRNDEEYDPTKLTKYKALHLRTPRYAPFWVYYAELGRKTTLVVLTSNNPQTGAKGTSEERQELDRVRDTMRALLQSYSTYLITKEHTHLPILSFLHQFPGLVHFIFVDRTFNRVIAPSISALHAMDCPPDEEEERNMKRVIKRLVWDMCYESQQHLSEGAQSVLVKNGPWQFSYRLWVEDVDGFELIFPPEVPFGTPHVPQTNKFYQKLMHRFFPTRGNLRCYELYTLYLSALNVETVAHHDRELVSVLLNRTMK